MSAAQGEKYRDIVKRETEPDDDEDGDEDGDEPEAKTTPEAASEPEAKPMGEADVKRIETGIKRARETYTKALNRIDGLEAELWGDCDTCGGIGLVPPDFTPPPDLLDAPDKVRCDGCNGHGVQRTPSLAPLHETEQCISCGGNGWKTRPIPEPAPYSYTANVPPIQTGVNGPAGLTQTPPTPGTTDAWQRPVGHPHFGIPPASLGVQALGLVAQPIIAAGLRVWPTWPAPAAITDKPIGDNANGVYPEVVVPRVDANRTHLQLVPHWPQHDTRNEAAQVNFPRNGVVIGAISLALVVWLVYFVIEVARQLHVWPFQAVATAHALLTLVLYVGVAWAAWGFVNEWRKR